MGKGGSPAPTPDPAIGNAAIKQAELGEDWLAFAEQQFQSADKRQTRLDKLNEQVTRQQMSTMQQGADWAAEDRERYTEKFLPMEDRFIEKAENWDSPERQAKLADEAGASVLSQSEAARGQNQRQMRAMGVDPRSGRYAGVNAAQETSTALGAAGARNQARNQVRNQGMAMEADAINLGRGLPSQAAGGANLGLSAGGQAIQGNMGVNQMANNNSQIMGQGFQGAMGGYQGQANTLNSLYGNELSAWGTKQQADSSAFGGLMSGIGTGLGMWAGMSSRDYKENKRKVKDGDSLSKVKALPIERWKYKDGIADSGEHTGTYAEDFQKQTGSGDGKSIPIMDAIGLTMGAVKDLDKKVDKLSKGGKK